MKRVFRFVFIIVTGLTRAVLFGGAIFVLIMNLFLGTTYVNVWIEACISLVLGILMLGLLTEFSFLEKRIKQLEAKIESLKSDDKSEK